MTISCALFPTSVFGEDIESKETSVGIGFRDEQPAPSPDPSPTPNPNDPAPYEPVPIDNVLPVTLGQTRYQTQPDQSQAASRGTLPKTGEQRQTVFLRAIGLACIASCFWLFLFTRLREEEENA
nr:LPXTG cell wall anchor domain-containing protein [Enterococcus sp. 669A]